MKIQKTVITKTYQSTQRCTTFGYVNPGQEKVTLHSTYNKYICYKCGCTNNRDNKTILSNLALAN